MLAVLIGFATGAASEAASISQVDEISLTGPTYGLDRWTLEITSPVSVTVSYVAPASVISGPNSLNVATGWAAMINEDPIASTVVSAVAALAPEIDGAGNQASKITLTGVNPGQPFEATVSVIENCDCDNVESMPLGVAITTLIEADGSGSPNLVTIDFDDYAPATVISDQYAAEGVTFSLEGEGAPAGLTQRGPIPINEFGTGGGVVFAGDSSTSDFNYDVRIEFSGLADFFSIYALDAEEPFSIRAYLGSTLVGTASLTNLGYVGPLETYGVSGPMHFAALGAIDGSVRFDSVVIDLSNGSSQFEGGPEAWDNLSVNLVAPFARISTDAAVVGANASTAFRLNDLLTDGAQNLTTFWRNNGSLSTAWFTLDLGSEHSVYELKIGPRGDTSYGLAITVGNTLSGGKVSSGTTTSCQTWGVDSATPTYLQSCYLSASGRYVTVQGKGSSLRVHGVEVYGEPPGNLNLQPTAEYSFVVDPDTLTVDFDASASSDPNGSVVKYLWDFGDGSTGTGMTVSHQYASEGQHRVTLTVMDEGGVKAAVSKRPSVYSSGLTYLGATALAAGANDSTRARIVDRLGTFQRLETSWVNDGLASTAWFTLDLGSSRSVGELRIAPRADRSYNLEVTISDSLSGGKANGAVAGYCVTTAGPAPVPTALQSCQVSGQGRYVTVRESARKWLTFHGIEVLGAH